jgi:hypothetical protein
LKAQGVIAMQPQVSPETPPVLSVSLENSLPQTSVTSTDNCSETGNNTTVGLAQTPGNNTESLAQFLSTDTGTNNASQQSLNLQATTINFSNPSISKPLVFGVDPKIKAKIWANEFIDLGVLLNKKFPKVRFQAIESHDGGISWEKQQPLQYCFETVAHWLSAFHIFVSIYCEKYTDQACPLMKYAHTIQTLARRSGDIAAFHYDRAFREWLEHDWGKLPWDQVNNELYSEAVFLGLTVKFNSLKGTTSQGQKILGQTGASPFPSTGVPMRNSKKGPYCYSYNSGKCDRGPDCTYAHVCAKCRGMHGKKYCKTISQKGNNSNTKSNSHHKRSIGPKSNSTK